MLEITLFDTNFGHQEYLTPYFKSNKIIWKRDGIRRRLNVYTDNLIKSSVITIPQDGNLNICVLLEPLTNPGWTDIYEYIRTDFEKFDLIITHNLDQLGDLIENRPDKFHYSTKCITTSWLSLDMIKINDKNKMVSMPFSYKNFSEGHRIRHVIYEKYAGTNKIDFFGDGVPNFQGEFRNCFKDYKYVIVCENTLQKGFNSEKFNDSLLTGCIPIYWGSKVQDMNYKSNSIFYFSPESNRVNFNFDESLQNLEKVLDFVYREDPYNNLIESVKSNYEYSLTKKQTEDNIFEVLLSRGMVENLSNNIVVNPIVKKSLTESALKFRVDKAWYHGYTDFYEKYFSQYQNPNIIEIGTAGHGSTQMFLDYYEDCNLVGMDIVNYCDFKHPNFRFVNGNQNNIEDLQKLINNESAFDIILDDGSHTMKQQIAFGYLIDFVKSGGLYILEDIHTSFNPSFIESDCQFTTYEMLQKIIKKEFPFSNYIDENKQRQILERIESVEIFAKNPDDLTDSVTSVLKLK